MFFFSRAHHHTPLVLACRVPSIVHTQLFFAFSFLCFRNISRILLLLLFYSSAVRFLCLGLDARLLSASVNAKYSFHSKTRPGRSSVFRVLFLFLSVMCLFYYLLRVLNHCFLIPFSRNFSVPFGLSETREKRTTDKNQNTKLNKKKPKQNNTQIFIHYAM